MLVKNLLQRFEGVVFLFVKFYEFTIESNFSQYFLSKFYIEVLALDSRSGAVQSLLPDNNDLISQI